MKQPIARVNVLFDSHLTADEAMNEALVELTRRSGSAVIQQDNDHLVIRAGSRAHFRVWGTSRGRQRLPILIDASIWPNGPGSRIRVTLQSDEGWYVLQLPGVELPFQETFREIEAGLREGLDPSWVDGVAGE